MRGDDQREQPSGKGLATPGPALGHLGRGNQGATAGHAKGNTLSVTNLSHTFTSARYKNVVAISNLSIHISACEFVSLVGPSGCGKSTLFNIVAGLIKPSQGRVLINGTDVTGNCGNCGYMLQKDLLLPWRTVIDNAALMLDIQRQPRAKSRRETLDLLERFGLAEHANQYPHSISGGMRQRVAFIRTLLSGKDVLLLDEPLGALDAQTRILMQEWLLEVWADFHKTVLFITHDIEEAIFLSDRIYVLSARPARILDELSIDLERPRSPEMRSSEIFLDARGRVMDRLRLESLKAFRLQDRGDAGSV